VPLKTKVFDFSDRHVDFTVSVLQRDRPGLSGAQKRKQKTPLLVTVNNQIGGMPTPPLPEKRIPLPLPLPQNLPGPVRVLTAKDGAKMYSCPECNLFYADQLAFEVHLQGKLSILKTSFVAVWFFRSN